MDDFEKTLYGECKTWFFGVCPLNKDEPCEDKECKEKKGDKMCENIVVDCKCDKECLCQECENWMKHPIKIENNLYEVTEMGYKCTEHQVYSLSATLKGFSYNTDIVTGEIADGLIKSVFDHAELTIRQMQKGEIEIKYKY